MGKHRVYIREHLETVYEKEANRLGITTAEVIRLRLEAISTTLETKHLRDEITQCQKTILVVFQLLENLGGEVGFLSGATRASTKNSDNLTREGTLLETHFKRLATALKRGLSDPSKPKKEETANGL